MSLLSAVVAANPLPETKSQTNPVQRTNDAPGSAVETKDSVEKAYEKLVEDDDAAQAEVDQWIQENNEFAAKGAGVRPEDLNRRIRDRRRNRRRDLQAGHCLIMARCRRSHS